MPYITNLDTKPSLYSTPFRPIDFLIKVYFLSIYTAFFFPFISYIILTQNSPIKELKNELNTKKGPKDTSSKRHKKKKYESYNIYIYKVLKNIHPEVGISKKAMNSFVNDLFERVALESSKLARYHGKQTLSSNDVQSAVKLILPGDLAEHAIAEGTRAMNKFAQQVVG